MVRSLRLGLLCGAVVVFAAAALALPAAGQPAAEAPAAGQAAAEQTGATAAQAARPEIVIAVVDAEFIFQKSLAAQSIQRQLDVQRAELTKSFASQEEALRTAEQDLARQRLALDPPVFETRRRDFERKVAEARRAIQERTRKLDISFNEARDTLLRTINEVVAEVARDRKVGVVLRRDMVLFQAEGIVDISETVLQRLNAKLPQVTVNLPD